jgi:hypothetical protein
MERILQSLINKIDKEYIDVLYGKGSYFKIHKINWLTQLKCYQITLTLYCTDLELTKEAYPDGIEYFMKDAWGLLGIEGKYVVVSSLDVKL